MTAIKQGKPCPVYLLVGDRYLSLQVADQLAEALIPDQVVRGQNVNHVDGDQEDAINTLNHLKTYGMFTGRQIFRVLDSKLFHSKEVAKTIWDKAVVAQGKNNSRQVISCLSQLAAIAQVAIDDLPDMSAGQWQAAFDFAKKDTDWLVEVLGAVGKEASPIKAGGGADPADLYMAAIEDGLPDDNILMLLAENVDKRKKLYKCILKCGVVIDLAVADGSSKAARTEQDALLADLVRQTLADFGKSMEARAVPILLERVGFHPVAAVRETEKLALYVGEAPQVSVADVKELVSRSREDALYELTEAFTDRDLSQVLIIAGRLFDSGVHPLVMIAGLRNQVRKLMLVASLRRGGSVEYVEGMTFPVFQKGYLPALKESRGEWLAQLPSHPYALYMMFVKAGKYTVGQLGEILSHLLAAEFRLKSSGLPPLLVIENFLWQVLVE
ncbi:MAG: DNA polymerase III subunit delta [Proteobacteria bacterium]|nr:DNA polymerase III subunit delta [Desulfobulbaceae bacterium]MBU4152794.1 DNA polymerase III subunit delta [Pseudomonadota bacterium]